MKILKYSLLILSVFFLVALYAYGVNNLMLGSDELYPARAVISSDWNLLQAPWPQEATREYFANWPIPFPLLFGLLTRFSVVVWGQTHFALRFWPLLFGLLSVPAMVALFKRFVPAGFAAVSAFLMAASSDKLITYSKSLKHYTADVFFSALLLLLGTWIVNSQKRLAWILFTAFASIAIWIAFGSVYVVAGVYVYLLLAFVVQKRANRQFWLSYLLSGFVFALSFLGVYLSSVTNAVSNQTFLDDWGFTIFNVSRASELSYLASYLKHIFLNVLQMPAYFFNGSLFIGILFSVFIVVWLISSAFKRRFLDMALMLLPLGFLILASLAGKYPFDAGRTSLFLLPVWGVMAVGGFYRTSEWLSRNKPIYLMFMLIVPLCFVPFIYSNTLKVINYKLAGGREVDLMMQALKEGAQDGDTAYVQWGAILPFYFYASDLTPGYASSYEMPDSDTLYVIYGEEHLLNPELYARDIEKLSHVDGRLWLVLALKSETPGMQALVKAVFQDRQLLSEQTFKGCRLLLFSPPNEEQK